jgi:putative membrane protein
MSYLNDPRVLFAAERTLMAYNRSSLAMMAFGFAVERFTLFARMLQPGAQPRSDHVALVLALALVMLGVGVNLFSIAQHRALLASLSPAEIPQGHRVHTGMWINACVALIGAVLAGYLLVSSR